MTVTKDDFEKIWASSSPLTPYSFTDSNYKEGWNFVGSTPPSRQMWDFLQKNNDEKAKFLLNNFADYLPLSGGEMTGAIVGNPLTLTADDGNDSADLVLNSSGSATWNGKEVERVNASGSNYIRYESGLQICLGTGSTAGGIHQYTFPVAFSSTPYISLTPTSAENSTPYFCKTAEISETGFKALTMNSNGYTQLRTYYVAVGWWK